jgi:hypothetical protein
MSEVPSADSGVVGVQQIELSLANLPPGEYILEIKTVGGSAGVTQLVGFRITR